MEYRGKVCSEYQKMRFQYFMLNDNIIYIFDTHELEVVAHSLEEILNVTLLQREDCPTWSLYCLTRSGKLYRLCRDEAVKSESKPIRAEDNQKIFSELLSEDEDCGDDEDDFGIQLQYSTKPVYELQTCHLILEFSQLVKGLSVADSLISVVTECPQGYTVQLYEYRETFTNDISLEKKCKTLNFQCMSKKSLCPMGSYKVVIKTAHICQNSESNIHSTDVIILDQSVSKVLFWMEPVLLRAPIILLCTPEGSVYFTSTLSFHLHQAKHSVNEFTNNTPWKLLCDTGSQAIDIMQLALDKNIMKSSTLAVDSTVDITNTLAVCCRGGQVLLFMVDISKPKEPQLADIILTGPIVALCSFNCRLYHCTDKLMYETSLAVSMADGNQASEVTITQSKMYKHAGVLGLICCKSESSTDHKDAVCMLTYATVRGEVKTIKSTEFCDNLTPVSSGQIKYVLLAMDNLETRRQQLHIALQKQDSLLQQINIAGHLMQHDHKINEHITIVGSDHHSVLPCHCEAKVYTQYGEKHIQMCVKVTNQTGVVMSHDWKFLLTMIPTDLNLTEPNVISVIQTLKDSFKPGDSFTMTVKVEPGQLLLGWSLSITALLDLTQLVQSSSYVVQEEWSESTEVLSAKIYSQYIDVMFFMLPDNFESRQNCLDVHGSDDTTGNILKLAKLKPLASVYKDDVKLENTPTNNAVPNGTTICLSHTIHMRERTFKHLQKHYTKGLCCVLQHLLRDSLSCQPQTGNDISIVSMLGQQVHLSVTKVETVAKDISSVSSVDLEVKVRGEPYIVAAVHTAVVSRVKDLQNELCFPPVGEREMKRKLYKLQELQDDVQTYSQTREANKGLVVLANFFEQLRTLQIT